MTYLGERQIQPEEQITSEHIVNAPLVEVHQEMEMENLTEFLQEEHSSLPDMSNIKQKKESITSFSVEDILLRKWMVSHDGQALTGINST